MAKFSNKVQGKEVGQAEVYAAPHNMSGQQIANLVSKEQNAGTYNIRWDAAGLASGLYYYKLQAGEFMQVRKMLLIK